MYVFVDMHTKSQQCVAGKFFAVLIFFLSRRTEVPQCSGQACFDGEREERGNTEKKRGKRLVRKGATLALEQSSGSTKKRQKESGHESECHKWRAIEDVFCRGSPLHSSLACRLFVYLTQFWFDWCFVWLMGLWLFLTFLHSSNYCLPSDNSLIVGLTCLHADTESACGWAKTHSGFEMQTWTPHTCVNAHIT